MSHEIRPLHEPFERFRQVLAEAEATGMVDPNAMTVASVDAAGQPSARVVLLKSADEQGFVFFTNLESRKGTEILAHPQVSLSFFWREMGKQVIVLGTAGRVSDEEADAYFATRPRTSQLGAWASQQSRPLPGGRGQLLAEVARVEARHPQRLAVPGARQRGAQARGRGEEFAAAPQRRHAPRSRRRARGGPRPRDARPGDAAARVIFGDEYHTTGLVVAPLLAAHPGTSVELVIVATGCGSLFLSLIGVSIPVFFLAIMKLIPITLTLPAGIARRMAAATKCIFLRCAAASITRSGRVIARPSPNSRAGSSSTRSSSATTASRAACRAWTTS